MAKRFLIFFLLLVVFFMLFSIEPPKNVIKIDKISEWYEAAYFDHLIHNHISCEKCHHKGFKKSSTCEPCHKRSGNLNLKEAYHGVCLECHTEKGKSIEENCESCHKPKKLKKG